MISDVAYMAHPKVRQARALLLEAWTELRREEAEETARTLCSCGHRRDRHGPAYSINYTGGVCAADDCRCMNFLQKNTR